MSREKKKEGGEKEEEEEDGHRGRAGQACEKNQKTFRLVVKNNLMKIIFYNKTLLCWAAPWFSQTIPIRMEVVTSRVLVIVLTRHVDDDIFYCSFRNKTLLVLLRGKSVVVAFFFLVAFKSAPGQHSTFALTKPTITSSSSRPTFLHSRTFGSRTQAYKVAAQC